MGIQIGLLIINFLTLLVLAVTAYFYKEQAKSLKEQVKTLNEQISKEHGWNRRKTAHDLVNQMMQREILEIRQQLSKYADFHNISQTYKEVVNRENEKELQFLIEMYLDYFEGIALGIKHNIIDDDIAYEYLGALVPAVYRWSKPYIDEILTRTDDPTIYVEIKKLVESWQNRDKE